MFVEEVARKQVPTCTLTRRLEAPLRTEVVTSQEIARYEMTVEEVARRISSEAGTTWDEREFFKVCACSVSSGFRRTSFIPASA